MTRSRLNSTDGADSRVPKRCGDTWFTNPSSTSALALCRDVIDHVSPHDAAFVGAVGAATTSDVNPPFFQEKSTD